MNERFASHLCRKKPLRNLSMARSCPALLLLALQLSGSRCQARTRRRRRKKGTYDCVSFQRRHTTVKDEHRTDAIKQELAYTTKKAQDVRVHEGATLFVTHSGLELVDPYTRVDREGLAFHGFEPLNAVCECSIPLRNTAHARNWTANRCEKTPEGLDTHFAL